MNNQKNLLYFLSQWWEHRQNQPAVSPSFHSPTSPPASRIVRLIRWLTPNGGTLLLVLVLLLSQQVWASPSLIPTSIPGPSATTVNYQGRLADSSGNPVADSSYSMSFALYDAASGGNLVWGPETHGAVPVSGGLFSVGLGSQTSGGIPTSVWNGDRYLEVTVGGETLSPRELIRSVPIAGMALTASKVNIVRQDDTVNSDADRVIRAGWGYIQGDGVGMSETVDFGFTFAEPPIVVVSFLGGGPGTGNPSPSIGDFHGGPIDTNTTWDVAPGDISVSGFALKMRRSSGSFSSASYYGYSWVAIGTAP